MDRAFHRYLKRPTRRRLASLIRQCHALVWETALRATGSRDDADDIAQDVFLDLLLRPPPPGSVSSPRGYLVWKVMGRVTNLARAEARRRARERRGRETAISDGVAAEDLEALRAAVAALPAELRAPIEMRYFGGLANREIAAVLGVAERTVEKRLQDGRKVLRSRLARLSGAALLLDRDGTWAVAAPPAALLSSLLVVAARGGALSASLGASSLGGSIMAKKVALFLGIAAACGLGWIVSREVRREGSGDPQAPHAVVRRDTPVSDEARPAAAEPGAPAGAADAVPARPPFASVHGTLIDPEDEPVPGARILALAEIAEEEAARLREIGFLEAAAGTLERETTSDDTGAFRLENLLPVKHRLYIRSETVVGCWPPLVELSAGEGRVVAPELCFAHALSGRITDAATGLSIEGGAIIPDGNGAVSILEARVENGGHEVFLFPADREGRYEIGFGLVLRRGMDTDPLRVTATAPGYAAKTLLVRADEFRDRRATLDFALVPERRALVRVIDAAGRPVAGARVQPDHHYLLGVFHPSRRTDAAGQIVLERLAPERYSLGVRCEGYRDASATLEADRPPDVQVTVVLEPLLAPVRGKIIFDPRIPEGSRIVSSSIVWLDELDPSGRVFRCEGTCDPEKLTYSIAPQRAGTYRLAWRLGSGPARFGDVFRHDGSEPIERDVSMSVEPPYIAGRAVRAGTSEGVDRLEVSVALPESGGDPWADETRVNGFRFPRPVERHLPSVRTDGQGRFLVPLPGNEGGPAISSVTVRSGSREAGWAAPGVLEYHEAMAVDDLLLEVEPPGAIEGTVVAPDGKPARKEVVAAWNGGVVAEHATTGDDGTYRIEGLPAGDYLVLPVGREDFRPFGSGDGPSAPLPDPAEFFDFPLHLTSGATVRVDLDLARDSPGRIDATVPADMEEAARIAYGMLVGGRVARKACLGGQEPLLKDRPVGPLFGIREHLLLPGSYLVWLEDGERRRLAEAVVDVRKAETSTAVFARPEAALAIPVMLPPDPKLDGVEIVRLEAFDEHAPDPSRPWVEWGGQGVLRAGNVLRLECLPSLRVRVLIDAAGCRQTWSGEADLRSRADAELDPVVLDRVNSP
jgi:RNA polymerase sigma-70 factor (ECF subfamily)